MRGNFVVADHDRDLIEFHLRKWTESVCSEQPHLFEKRLALENLTIEDVCEALLPVHFPENHPLPTWTQTLEHWIETASYVSSTTTDIPLSEVLRPVIQNACRRVEDACPEGFRLIAGNAIEQMKRNLMAALSSLCIPAVASDLNLAHHLKRLVGDTPGHRYQNFLKERLGSSHALLEFLREYPVLARLVAIRTEKWIDSTSEFLQSLRIDLHSIENTFSDQKPVGRVIELVETLSDPHNNGRTVKELLFENGIRILYKPRDPGIEVSFVNVIQWLNKQEISPGLRTMRLLDKGSYGWAEFIEWKPCTNSEEVTAYFQRVGMLLCVLYVLGTTDSHRENVVASGDSPVLVDMEVLLRIPDPAGMDHKQSAAEKALHLYQDSVMSTGLLPEWRFGIYRRPGVDVSGISGEGQQESPFVRTKWSGFNTDLIYADQGHPVLKQLSNQPKLSGEKIDIKNQVKQIVNGFEKMYRFILKERDRLSVSPLFADLSSKAVRYLNRPTKEYAMILDRSMDVESLRDGVTWSLRVDLLCRSLLNRPRDHAWQLLRFERAALERLDIPYFTARANATSLHIDREEVSDFLHMSAAELLQQRLRKLSETDMQQQISWIEGSFAARYGARKKPADEFHNWMNRSPVANENLLDQAVEIAKCLSQHAIRSKDGSMTWIGLEFIPYAEQYQLQPMSVGLYGGLSGVVLFLSALHHFVPNKEYSALARSTIQTIRWLRTNTSPQELVRQYGLGGMTGIGSVAYSLAWSSRLLNETTVMEEAIQWTQLIKPDAIESEPSLDFLSGVAGIVSAILRMYRSTGDGDLLARAMDYGHRLLQAQSNVHSGGFSLGASGMGHSLIQLHAASGNQEFYEAAISIFQKERFVETASWCNGVPGMALSRLSVAAMFPEIIQTGLDAAKNYEMSDFDHLCCGNCGRIDILLTAAKRLSRIDLFDVASRQMSAVLSKARATGAFYLMNGNNEQMISAGLFKGLSGIGYTCLRLADVKNVLPSILLME